MSDAGSTAGSLRADAVRRSPSRYARSVFTTVGTALLLLAFGRPLRRLLGGVG